MTLPRPSARVSAVFEQARDVPIGERRVFLTSTCAGEAGVLEQVERLLAAHEFARAFVAGGGSRGDDVTVAGEAARIPGYELLAFLGAGGMGEVYKARDTNLDRPVALKLLPPHVARKPERLRRFRAEARAASSLNHPHILVVHDFGECRGRPFMVTEFVEGQTLRQRIAGGPVPAGEAAGIVAQIALALAAAHSRGVVHRDIKPENVMLRPDGYVKVLDFGLARQIEEEDGDTRSGASPGALVGTLRYMSPEQTRGQQATPASDVFSLGLVLFELIAGRHPFESASSLAVLTAIQSGTAGASGAGGDVDRLLAGMLDKQPSRRPAASEVAARLTGSTPRTGPAFRLPPTRTTVGRVRERTALRSAFSHAAQGQGRIVAVTGEPGIGKSTLVAEFLSEIETPVWIGTGRCSERLAGAQAHLPWLDALDSLAARDPGVGEVMGRYAPGWLAQIAAASAADSPGVRPATDAPSGSADRLMREMAVLLRELSSSRPVVLFLDDVHWADLSTVDLLRYLAEKLASLRVLILVTYRPADLVLHKHPFLHVKSDLMAHGLLGEVAVAFLASSEVADYVAAQLPAVPRVVADAIYRKTEGNPLFMADLVRYLQERGAGADLAVEIEHNVPESLRGMIDRKLEGLADGAQQLLRVAAIQGVQFDSAIVAQVLGQEPADVEDTLQSLDRVHGLVQLLREQVLPNQAFSLRYQFVHVLYQGALHGSVSPSRAAAWSARVAAALETAHGDRRAGVAAELAVLYEMARDPWGASEHFLAASEVASSRFATREAVAFARRGLACLAAVPDSSGARRRELALQKALRVPLAILEGYGTPGTERVSDRVIALSEELADHASLFAALDGAFLVHMVRGECVAAAEISERMIGVAQVAGSEAQQMLARTWAMIARHHLGDLAASQRHADICIEMGTPANQGSRLISILDPVVAALAESSRNAWMMGDSADCLDRTARATRLARAITHPDSLSFALLFHGWMHGHCDDWETCLATTTEAITLGTEHGLVQTMAWNHCVHGWALAHTGRAAEGLPELETGIEASTRIMGEIAMPHFVAMLAEVLILRHEHGRALEEVQRILKRNETSRDCNFNAELHRLAAACHAARGDPGAAERSLHQAVETARAQGATRLELRAATAMARLWAGRSERRRARELLEPVYARLPEREDTDDVRGARRLLAALG